MLASSLEVYNRMQASEFKLTENCNNLMKWIDKQ